MVLLECESARPYPPPPLPQPLHEDTKLHFSSEPSLPCYSGAPDSGGIEKRNSNTEKVLRFVNYNQACVHAARGGGGRECQPFSVRELSVNYIFLKTLECFRKRLFRRMHVKEKKKLLSFLLLLGNIESAAKQQKNRVVSGFVKTSF